MKKFLLLSWICFIASCSSPEPECNLTPVDARMMHLVIERSHPDTVAGHLSHYIIKYGLPTTAFGLPDGTYAYSSPPDDFGYIHSIEIDVRDDSIIRVHYDEHTPDGHSKADDAEYGRKMDENVMGSAPSVVYPEYMQQLLAEQDLMEMDAVSGATYSLYRMRFAGVMAFHSGKGLKKK